jgi:hypothetical protein
MKSMWKWKEEAPQKREVERENAKKNIDIVRGAIRQVVQIQNEEIDINVKDAHLRRLNKNDVKETIGVEVLTMDVLDSRILVFMTIDEGKVFLHEMLCHQCLIQAQSRILTMETKRE